MAAALSNAPEADKKELFIEQCALNLPLHNPIYRIFQLAYLAEDIRKKRLTHMRPEVWNDPYENPLASVTFIDSETREPFSLRGITDKLFAQSWTYSPHESYDFWDEFGHLRTAVRVQTTVFKLLKGVMSLQNRFCMLNHFLGLVNYRTEAEIRAYLQSLTLADVLDSLGQGVALSLMTLRRSLSPEREARLVYWHQPQDDNPWVAAHVRIENDRCRVPFDWNEVIDAVVIGPRVPAGQRICIRNFFNSRASSARITDSSL